MKTRTLPPQRARPDSESLDAEDNARSTFKLRRASFKGRGLRMEMRGADADWETSRDLSYGMPTRLIRNKQD